MQSKIAIYVTLALLALGVWFFYQAATVSSRGNEAPLYSSERHDPYGTAALKDLLAERGVAVSELRHPYPDEASGVTLIRVLPMASFGIFDGGPSLQNQRLKDWIAQGNTVVEFTRDSTDLMRAYGLGIDMASSSSSKDLHAIEKDEAAGKPQDQIPAVQQDARWIATPTSSGHSVPMSAAKLQLYSPVILKPESAVPASTAPAAPSPIPAPSAASATAPSDWQPLAFHEHSEAWVAAIRRVGNGRLIVVGAPTPILNGTINEASNLDFVLALLAANNGRAPGEVWFDEWAHDIGHANTIMGFIQEVGLLPALLQIMIVLVFYIWSTSGYRRVDAVVATRRRSSIEQTNTLGYLYSQSLKPDLVFEKVYTEVRRRLASALRCSPTALESCISLAKPEIAARASAMLALLDTIGRGQGPTCPACGYDLTHNTSGQCPECGNAIPLAVRDRVAQTIQISVVPERRKKKVKTDVRLAAVLRQSHQFLEELTRARNLRR